MSLSSKIDIEFTKLIQLEPKDLKIRKKIDIFIGDNTQKESSLILQISQKSRFLQKDVDKIEEILQIIKQNQNKNFKKKYIVIEAPLCSKAKAKFETLAWSVFN